MPWGKIVYLPVSISVDLSFTWLPFQCDVDLTFLLFPSFILFPLEPWNHLLFGAVGGYIGYNYKSWEASLLAKVNEKRVLRGMAPIDRQSMA